MAYAKKIVLHCPQGYSPRLEALTNQFIQEGVLFVAVVGPDAAEIEERIDFIVVGDGTSDAFILTSCHPTEGLEEVIEFARDMITRVNDVELDDPVEVIVL